MALRNGNLQAVADYVRAHPGQRARDIGQAVGFNHHSGLLTYARKQGLIHAAGPTHWQRYYPTAEAAEAAHARICAEAKAESKRKERAADIRANLRLRAKRAEKNGRVYETRPDRKVVPGIPRGAVPAHDCRITIAPPIPDRWAPEPGFVGEFTSEWRARTGASE